MNVQEYKSIREKEFSTYEEKVEGLKGSNPEAYQLGKELLQLLWDNHAELTIIETDGKKIRLWKLGSLDHRIWPTKGAFDELSKLIKGTYDNSHDVVDLLWTPDLKVETIE